MSETKKYFTHLTLLDGSKVYVKDEVAREAIQGGTHFRGVTTTALTDGASTNPIQIGGNSYTALNGDMVAYSNKEFIFADFDSKWHELGDLTGLGALALKDSASGSYTPAGSVSFTGSATQSTGKFTPEGSVSFTGGTVSSSGNFTPEGSVSKPDVDVTPTTANIKEVDQAGSVTAGSAASLGLTYTEGTEELAITFTPNTPTAVTLPTTKQTAVVTGVAAELHEAPAFTGTQGSVSVSGTAAGSCAFTGTEGDVSVSGTPEGTASFTGTAATITVS